MIALTPEEKKRLAEEAEILAMECLEGRGPEFTADNYCGCGIGVLIKRGLPDRWSDNYIGGQHPYYLLAVEIDRHLPEESGPLGLVSRALQGAVNEVFDRGGTDFAAKMQAAVVFPLLALRDALLEAP
jgi:hypothetical protein